MAKVSSVGKRRIVFSFSLGLIAALISYCHGAAAGGFIKPPHTQRSGTPLPPRIYSVPLICLMATPEKYDGKLVRTCGYVALGFENSTIFRHKEDCDNLLLENCIGFSQERIGYGFLNYDTDAVRSRGHLDPIGKVQLHYCIIEGVFDARDYIRNDGHLRRWGGIIRKIQRLESWSDPAHPRNLVKNKNN